MSKVILIVGMARSGTTLVSHILGSHPETHIEVEPHALWKSGNFRYLDDESFKIKPSIIKNIRAKFLNDLPERKILVEKSPINSLRPELVHAVFPQAKIIYIERDPIRCIHSNYKRSKEKDSFKLSIILKKYFLYTGSKDLDGAISKRTLFKQLSIKDYPAFIKHTLKMLYLRSFKNNLPFGPKLKNFGEIVEREGLLDYQVRVYKQSEKYKNRYKELYKENLGLFKMEDIMKQPDEIKRMLDFVDLEYTENWIQEIISSFDKGRVQKAIRSSEIDDKIKHLLKPNQPISG